MTIIYGNKENCNLIFLTCVIGMITNGTRKVWRSGNPGLFLLDSPPDIFLPSLRLCRPLRVLSGPNKKRRQLPPLFIWCGQQDSNLHALAVEPKGDVTLVNVLRCVKNTFLNNSNGYYRNAQVSSFVGDISILLFHQLAVYFLLGNAVDEKSNVLHLSSFEPAN